MGGAMKRNIKYIIISIIGTIIIYLMIHSLADFQRARKVLINDSEQVIMKFDDNKIETTAVLFSKWILNYHSSGFYLYIKYDLDQDITIHKDSLHIKYEGKTLKWYSITDVNSKRKKKWSFPPLTLESLNKSIDEGVIRGSNYKLSGKGHLAIPFDISDNIEVKEGDKIKITAPGFITYNGDTVSLEEMTIEIGNFFR
jgi:hypothetical protein